jgi:pseudo-response regulator 5
MSPDADAATTAAGGDGGGGGDASGASSTPAAAGRAVVRWDQILPRRSLRVLLVEHDDSTRQVITALLRKCGYRGELHPLPPSLASTAASRLSLSVITYRSRGNRGLTVFPFSRRAAVAAVADGMKAWEVMRRRAYAFDLVLTEVVMPTLSGIQLLARIVAAAECKNIPVVSKPSIHSDSSYLGCADVSLGEPD